MKKKTMLIEEQTNREEAGGFWCHTCLISHPAAEQSPDSRYCQGCYEFLLKEAEMDTSRRGGDWKPVLNSYKPLTTSETTPQKVAKVSQPMRQIKSTVGGRKIEVDKIQPSVAARAVLKRGPKHKALPQELVKQWASEGTGSKAIASKLKSELGIKVSYKTIQRLLSGEREFVKQMENKNKGTSISRTK